MEEHSVDNSIDDIIRENKIHRFATELEKTEEEERKKDIIEILYHLERLKTDVGENARSKLNVICDNIDQGALKRKWSKLTLSQRKDRIKDFFKRTIVDEKDRKKKEIKILDMLESGKLKQKFVTYDQVNGKIMSIDLEIDDKKDKTKKNDKKSSSSESDSSEESDVDKKKEKKPVTKKTNSKHESSQSDSDSSEESSSNQKKEKKSVSKTTNNKHKVSDKSSSSESDSD